MENSSNRIDFVPQKNQEETPKVEKKLKTLRIPCKKCGGRMFKIKIANQMAETAEYYPFPIILMHSDINNNGLHTLIAYLDKNLSVRSVDYLEGKNRVFITPYILYKPSLLKAYCYK